LLDVPADILAQTFGNKGRTQEIKERVLHIDNKDAETCNCSGKKAKDDNCSCDNEKKDAETCNCDSKNTKKAKVTVSKKV